MSVGQLAPLAAELQAATSPQALSRVLAAILEWPPGSRDALVNAVVAACATLASSGSPYAAACAAAVREAGHHPGDLGVVAMLLLRHTVLAPGQAVFMPAGGLHAYLRGTGIEVLANSDNVVRAGLTGKHVDVPELLKLLDPAVTVPVLTPAPLGEGVTWFDTPAPEFRLYMADLAEPAVTLPPAGPRIALCTDGAATLCPPPPSRSSWPAASPASWPPPTAPSAPPAPPASSWPPRACHDHGQFGPNSDANWPRSCDRPRHRAAVSFGVGCREPSPLDCGSAPGLRVRCHWGMG